MPEEKAEAAHDLGTYARFLADLEEAGHDYVVIGGCAVAAYARQMHLDVFSADLDLLVSQRRLAEILGWARKHSDLTVTKTPQPRSVPVAVMFWSGLEINVLTGSSGLPDPDRVADLAREVEIGDLHVPIADPFDLLANKLAVKREKDLPHIEILRRFVEAEIVETFESETNRRRRLAPARRYLELFQLDRLPQALAEQLLERARYGADYRFLASTAPDSLRQAVLDATRSADPAVRSEVERILQSVSE